METRTNSNKSCNRHEDLVTYLYDESNTEERRSFELHLEQCAWCSAELKDLGRVRDSLGAWNLAFESYAPPVQIEIKRNSIETLHDLLAAILSLPNWMKFAGGATLATAGLLVAFTIAGTRIDLGQGTISFGLNEAPRETQSTSTVASTQTAMTMAEVEKIIAERVATSTAEDRRRQEELSERVSTLSAQLTGLAQSRSRVAAELASLRAEQRVLARRGQATLGEWLFAANGPRESWGGSDERDN